MSRIFISATLEDLSEYRAAVRAALRRAGHDVIGIEDYRARDQRPLDRALRDIAASDLYVGIFAWRYRDVREAEGLSQTELEYRRAREAGTGCLIFLLDPDAPWPDALVDCNDSDAGRRIRSLRDKLSRSHTVDFFESSDQLAALVVDAVARAQADLAPAAPARDASTTRTRWAWAARVWALISHNPLIAAVVAGLVVAAVVALVCNGGGGTSDGRPTGETLSPHDRDTVTPSFTADGTLDAIPRDRHVWLVVQIGNRLTPKEPEIPSQDRHWVQEVDEAGQPPGGRFTLVLLMVDGDGQSEIEGWLRVGHETGEFPSFDEIPGSVKLDVVRDLVVG